MVGSQSSFKTGAGFETKDLVQLQFPYQSIHRRLTVLTVDLGENEPGGVSIIKTAEAGLHRKQFPRLVQCHRLFIKTCGRAEKQVFFATRVFAAEVITL